MGKIKTMYFVNNVFRDGINLTVRRGVEWDGCHRPTRFAKIGSGYSDDPNGKIVRTIVIRFADIANVERYLPYEHDIGCRTLIGLFEVMSEVYPGFDENEIVTLVFFYLDEGICNKIDADLCDLFHNN